QPLPGERESQAVMGHLSDGTEVPGGWHVFPEHAPAGLWSTPTDLANLLLAISRSWRGASSLFLLPERAREMLTPQNGGPDGVGGASGTSNGSPILMKRGQNTGYQAYLILLPGEGQGIVVMTDSDNGSIMAGRLIRTAPAASGGAQT